jgi:phage baseplate assembly protein W
MPVQLSRRSKEFVDISLSFEPHPLTKDLTTLKNERAINNSIKNLILIAPTEVAFQSDVGSHVRNSLFELFHQGTQVMLQEEIKRTIKFSEPRVELQDVFVKEYADDNELRVTVKYKIIGYDTVFTVEQILKPTN